MPLSCPGSAQPVVFASCLCTFSTPTHKYLHTRAPAFTLFACPGTSIHSQWYQHVRLHTHRPVRLLYPHAPAGTANGICTPTITLFAHSQVCTTHSICMSTFTLGAGPVSLPAAPLAHTSALAHLLTSVFPGLAGPRGPIWGERGGAGTSRPCSVAVVGCLHSASLLHSSSARGEGGELVGGCTAPLGPTPSGSGALVEVGVAGGAALGYNPPPEDRGLRGRRPGCRGFWERHDEQRVLGDKGEHRGFWETGTSAKDSGRGTDTG